MTDQSDQRFRYVYAPPELSPAYRCPCCKFKTLLGRAGDEICPVCFWEDDGQDEHDADLVRGGPNAHLSLQHARENFARYGASDSRFVEQVRAPQPEER